MISALDISLARGIDALAIAQMSRQRIEDGLPWRWTPERVARNLDRANANAIVGRIDGELAGFALMAYGEHEAHLLLMAVTAPRARQGVGSRLLRWLTGWTLRHEAGRPAHMAVGVISGMANAAGMGGLPVAVFFAAQPIAAAVFRATLIAYFAALDIWTLPLMWGHGLVSRDTLVVTLAALPLIGIGTWLGGRHFLTTDPQDFRRFSILLLAGLALLGLLRTVL